MNSDELKAKYNIVDTKQDIKIPDFSGMSGIILIVGSSGTGKSTILKSIENKKIEIDESKSIIENFSTLEQGEKLLISAGLRSVPTWFNKLNQVSNGEKNRAELAFILDQNIQCIDEYTSVVDRATAKSLSFALNKYNKKAKKTLYIASCHFDIENWLCPDYIYNTDTQEFQDKKYDVRPKINFVIKSSNYKDWELFKKHHYLSAGMNKAVHSYTAFIGEEKVGFLSIIHQMGAAGNFWRESRLVIIPEYQGLGLGVVLSNTIGQFYLENDLRYMAKTSHPALGEYRNKNKLWKATSSNGTITKHFHQDGTPIIRAKMHNNLAQMKRDHGRQCYSHEYVGENQRVWVRPTKEELFVIDDTRAKNQKGFLSAVNKNKNVNINDTIDNVDKSVLF